MSAWDVLHPLRIGCVKYLNSRPLIHAYDGEVIYDHPSALAREISRGQLDAGLVPIFEALGARHYAVVDDVAIACDGPVYSVFLAHRVPLAQLRTVAVDPASLTSVHMLKVLLAEFHGVRPQFVDAAENAANADAELWIGNQAIDFRHEHRDCEFLDLGEEWRRCTGLPFVFAVWMLRPDLERIGEVAAAFRELKRAGVAAIPQIVAQETFRDAEFRRRYLTEHIRFGLGPRERAGIEKYRELLIRHGFVPPQTEPLEFR